LAVCVRNTGPVGQYSAGWQ